MYDLTVIGGGPAGLTAALYAHQKGLDVLLISRDLGGKTNYRLALPWVTDPNQVGAGFLRGLDLVNKIRGELEAFHFNYLNDAVETVSQAQDGFAMVRAEGDEIFSRALVVTTGTGQVPLNVPGEKEFFLRGVSYSALSYAGLFRDRRAAVIGEGELAIRSAADLATVASQVILVCNHGEMLAIPTGQKLKNDSKVKILEGYQVVEIQGNGQPGEGFADTLVVKSPQGRLEALDVDGIFIERGLVPNSGLVADLVHLDPAGRIRVDSSNCTSVAGIFAAGDVASLYAENMLVAMGEGAKAALSAYDYLLSDY